LEVEKQLHRCFIVEAWIAGADNVRWSRSLRVRKFYSRAEFKYYFANGTRACNVFWTEGLSTIVLLGYKKNSYFIQVGGARQARSKVSAEKGAITGPGQASMPSGQ
jgi:hypothetical protein